MDLRRMLVVIGLAAAIGIQQGSLSASAVGQQFVALMFCTPWSGCTTAFFYYEDVQVVANSGHLDVDWSGWWGNRGGCEECEFETLEPPEHPEPVPDPGEGGCGDERDTIIAEYVQRSVGFVPVCNDFATGGGSGAHFTWSEMNQSPGSGHPPYGIVRSVLWNGLEGVRADYGHPVKITSGYRCPHGNQAVGGAPLSRHQFGDAADMKSYSPRPWDESEWVLIADAASANYAGFIEPYDWDNSHVHAD